MTDLPWTRLGAVDPPPSVCAALGLPAPPPGDLGEFGPRYTAALRAAWRYHRAFGTVPPGTAEHDRLAAGWTAVLAQLERAGRLCAAGRAAPNWAPRRRPGVRQTRRQRLSPRERHLHNMHKCLIALERAADAAVALAVGVALSPVVDVAVEEALSALSAALAELA
jgi:hypothetical protein